MAESEKHDAEDTKSDAIENFLRPFEKQDRETLDRMFEKAKECIEKQRLKESRHQNRSEDL